MKSLINIFCIASILVIFACNSETQSPSKPQTPEKKPQSTATAPPTKPKAPEKQYYTSSVFAFKVLQPSSWEIIENRMPNLPVIFINKAAGGRETISIGADNKTYGDLVNYYDISRDFLLNSGQIQSITEESEGKTKAGVPFKRIIFQQSAQQGSLMSVSFLYFQNKMGYSVTCSAPGNIFDQQRTYYEEVGQTITF